MAIATNNGPKPNSGEVKQVLNFLKDILPHRYVRAIRTLLYPCCTYTGTAVSVCVGNPHTFDITITLDRQITTVDTSIQVYLNNVLFNGLLVSPNTITVQITTPAPIVLSSITLQIILFETTSQSGDIGVYQAFRVEANVDGGGCAVPSDIRLKKNIESVGMSPNGIPIYNFEYLESVGMSGKYQGVMAQDLLGTAYENAVIFGETYKVDYSKIDVEFNKLN